MATKREKLERIYVAETMRGRLVKHLGWQVKSNEQWERKQKRLAAMERRLDRV